MKKSSSLIILSTGITLLLIATVQTFSVFFRSTGKNPFLYFGSTNKNAKQVQDGTLKKCGDGICNKIEKNNPQLCPQDCQTVSQEIPYYFIAIHNEPHHDQSGFTQDIQKIEEEYLNLKQIIEKANRYNTKLTLMFTAQWADYIAKSQERMTDLALWKSQGHEIAAHHHDIYHYNWDGYTDYSKEETEKARASKGRTTPEKYLGTMQDYISHLKKINPAIKSGCLNEESDANILPNEIINATCSGFANNGEIGTELADSVPQKAKNDYLVVGISENIERKWLSHYQIAASQQKEIEAETQFNSMNSLEVSGSIAHSSVSERPLMDAFLDFLYSKDPDGNKSRTVSQIVDQKILPVANLK